MVEEPESRFGILGIHGPESDPVVQWAMEMNRVIPAPPDTAILKSLRADGSSHPGRAGAIRRDFSIGLLGWPADKSPRRFANPEAGILSVSGRKEFVQVHNCQVVLDRGYQVIAECRATCQSMNKQPVPQ